MNRMKRSSKSLPPQDVGNGGENSVEGLPPNGRTKENSSKNSAGSVGESSDLVLSSGSGGKKKKHSSFFSNLFKSKKTCVLPSESTDKGGVAAGGGEGLTLSSSYESVNSVDTTSSFTFVSSKKLRGKGHKGKRIPVDDDQTDRPSSSCENDRPSSAVSSSSKGSTLNKVLPPYPKKLGTLSKIGMKMGLKKKYNLQSCESLEHIATLPRPNLIQVQEKMKNKRGKKITSNSSVEQGAISSGTVLEPAQQEETFTLDETTSKKPELTSSNKMDETLDTVNTPASSSALQNSIEIKQKSDAKVSIPKKSTPTQEPIPSTSKISEQALPLNLPSGSGYSSDPNTWSSNTARKRRAPVPPKKSFKPDVIQIPGATHQQKKIDEKNVELKSVKPLDENAMVSSGERQLSYPSGALRRNKSKDKAHLRPFSCSCSNSIFAHHSKYQQYHKQSCNDGSPHESTSASIFNSNTLGRTHVRGKKKAPPPPTSELGEEHVTNKSGKPCIVPKLRQNKNPENPYGNPFLDEDSDGNNNEMDRGAVVVSCNKESRPCMSEEPGQLSAATISTNSSNVPKSSIVTLTLSVVTSSTSSLFGGSCTPSSFSTNLSTKPDNGRGASQSRVEPVVSGTSSVQTTLATTSVATTSTTSSITITTSSFSQPISSSSAMSECVVAEDPRSNQLVGNSGSAEDDEIAQNLLNDIQEKEQLASVQGSLSSNSPSEVNSSESSPITVSKVPASSSSKRIFNFSKKRSSNSHLQAEETMTQNNNDLETLLKSSPTLMAQAMTVDNQVKAHLQDNAGGGGSCNSKQQSAQPLKTSPSLKSKENASEPSSSASSLPLSPKLFSPSDVAAPRPWYKRGMGSSSSKNSSGTKSPPIRPTITRLPKFSDLDREAQKIVEENKRKSAEIAFNQNARDLINIFNTTFTTTGSSSTNSSSSTITVSSTTNNNSNSSVSDNLHPTSSAIMFPSSSTSAPQTTKYPNTSIKSVNDQKSVVQLGQNSQSKLPSTYPTETTSNITSRTTTTANHTTPVSTTGISSSSEARINSNTAAVSSTVQQRFSHSVEPSTSSAVSLTQTSTVSAASNYTSSTTTTPAQSISKLSSSSAFKPIKSSVMGEAWSCARCTLKNPSWRGLCEACHSRKLATTTSSPGIITNTLSNTSTKVSTVTSSISSPTMTQTTATSTNNSAPATSKINLSTSVVTPKLVETVPNGTQITATSQTTIKSNLTTFQQPVSQQETLASENLLSHHPTKDNLLKYEKLDGIQLNNDTASNLGEVDNVDIEKLRQVRLAFFAKDDKQVQPHNIISPDTSLKMNTACTTEPEVQTKSVNSNSIISSQRFDDGEDDSIDSLLFLPKIQNAPQRPSKNFNKNNVPNNKATNSVTSVPLSPSDVGPNFEILLQPNNSVPQQCSPNNSINITPQPLSVPSFRFRPMLDPISEADANYYGALCGDNRVYQNWQQPAQLFVETESYLGTNATNDNNISHFNIGCISPNLHNTSASPRPHPVLHMRQNIANNPVEESLASPPCANFRLLFSNPVQKSQNNDNNDAGISAATAAVASGFDLTSSNGNSQFLNSGFTSESDTEVDSEMDRHHRRHHREYNNRLRDNRHWNGGGGSDYSGERNLSYDDYRRLGAIPKGYYGGGGSGSNSDSGRRRYGDSNNKSQFGDEEDSRYFSESSDNSMVDNNPLLANKLLRKLEWAITHGEHRLAASLAHDLALLKVNCLVDKSNADPITIRVYVEDRFMQQGPFLVQVMPNMTLKDLKSKIEGDWGIPSAFQKWILGKKMADDDHITLANYDVVQDTMAFLYLVTPQIENSRPKEKEISPPPPPLPKKPNPASPAAVPPSHGSGENTSRNLQVRNSAATPMNQLKASANPTPAATFSSVSPTKVASSAQTETVLTSNNKEAKKSPLVTPIVETKGLSNGHNAHTAGKTAPISSVGHATPLYQRPSSPTRGEKSVPTGKIVPKEISVNLQTVAATHNKQPNQASLGSEPTKISSVNVQANYPISKSILNLETPVQETRKTTNNNVPLLLHVKLENLRQAAEQAFSKSFPLQQSEPQNTFDNNRAQQIGRNPVVLNPGQKLVRLDQQVPLNATSSKQIPAGGSRNTANKTSLECETSMGQNKLKPMPTVELDQIRTTSAVNLKDSDSRTKPPIQNHDQHKHTMSSLKIDGASKTVPASSTIIPKTENRGNSSPKATKPPLRPDKLEPVPKPRSKKTIPVDTDSETENVNVIPQKTVVDTPTSSTKETCKPEKVEGFCQTTLPFPGIKNPSKAVCENVASNLETKEKRTVLERSPIQGSNPVSPQSPPPPPNVLAEIATKNVKKEAQVNETTFIVANVLVSPIINKALFGMNNASLMRELSPPTRFQDNIDSSIRKEEVMPHQEDGTSSSITSSISSTVSTLNPEPKIPSTPTIVNNAASAPLSAPTQTSVTTSPLLPSSISSTAAPGNFNLNQPKLFRVPYFMQQADKGSGKQASPPSKVKLMAEKFNSNNSTSPKTETSSSGSQNKKNGVVPKPAIFSYDGKESNIQTYLSMLQMMEKQDLIMATDGFECKVCLSLVPPGDGVTLRDCLHNFCKDCLIGAVNYADDSEVKCPFRDSNYSCDSSLQEREIKALVPADVFEKYLARSVKLAERKMMNTFHCKTADCTGWCIYEDDVNIFKCPVCTKKNCITCAAIHEGMDCKQYQRQLAIDSETDENAKSSRLMLEKMIQRGEALECPACQVILLKKWGCDWVRCTCKTEICWVTRGLRWGPNGKGDTSGGCKCGLNGNRCHPKCTYCH